MEFNLSRAATGVALMFALLLLALPSLHAYAKVEIAEGANGHIRDVLGNIRSNSGSVQTRPTSSKPEGRDHISETLSL